MTATEATQKKPTISKAQLQIYRQIPGIRRDEGYPCLCGVEHLTTRGKSAFSDSRVYYHRCTNCENEFSTWTEG